MQEVSFYLKISVPFCYADAMRDEIFGGEDEATDRFIKEIEEQVAAGSGLVVVGANG